jgi:hypothetical protein
MEEEENRLVFKHESRLFEIPKFSSLSPMDGSWMGILQDTKSNIIVAYVEGSIFGDTIMIDEVAVHPDHQGKGLCRVLMNHVFHRLISIMKQEEITELQIYNYAQMKGQSCYVKSAEAQGFAYTCQDDQLTKQRLKQSYPDMNFCVDMLFEKKKDK